MPDLGLQLERLKPFYPGQFGVPGSDLSYGIRTASGNVFYVGDDDITYYDASDAHDGTDPIYPKATIQAALDACTNDRADTVVLLSDDYELTESLTVTVDRVRLIAWDYLRGESAPSVSITSATDDFTLCIVNADQVEIAGIRWANGSDTANDCIAAGSTESVIGLYIHHCKFAVGGGYGIQLGSANGTVNDCTIRQNTFIQIDDEAGAAGVGLNYVVRADVDSNLFLTDEAGTYGVSVIRNATTTGSIIRNNEFFVEEAAGVAIFRAGATVDVMMSGNMVAGGPTAASAITQLVDGGNYAAENYASSNAGGVLIDATT